MMKHVNLNHDRRTFLRLPAAQPTNVDTAMPTLASVTEATPLRVSP